MPLHPDTPTEHEYSMACYQEDALHRLKLEFASRLKFVNSQLQVRKASEKEIQDCVEYMNEAIDECFSSAMDAVNEIINASPDTYRA